MSIGTESFGGYENLSALLGVPVTSLRTYQARSNRNRAAGTPSPGDLPLPVKTIGGSPVWDLDQIREWDKGRRHTAEWKARNQG